MATTYTPTSTTGTDYTSKLRTNDIIQANYTGNQVPITVPAGSYQLECWGAQGGDGQFADYSQYKYTTVGNSDFTAQSYTYAGYYPQITLTMDGHESTMFLASVGYYNAAGHGNVSLIGNAGSLPNRSTGQIKVKVNTSGFYYIRGSVDYCYASLSLNGEILAEHDLESNASSGWGEFLDLAVGDVITLKCQNTNNVTRAHTCMMIGRLQIITPTPTLGTLSGGYGGYSSGILTLTEPTTLYLRSGGKGSSTIYSSKSQAVSGTVNAGGWNGGGSSRVCYLFRNIGIAGTSLTENDEALTSGGGGGGASDIRIGSDSLYARVIVAGGGGGASNENDITDKRGGGLEGNGYTTTGFGGSTTSYKGTQTEAGVNGSFGIGGSVTSTNAGMSCAGGGGGGWYGGGASSSVSNRVGYNDYNGGGSGYVYTSSTASNYPSGCLLNSNYYLETASTTTSTHTGNGLIKITCLDIPRPPAVWIKTNASTWSFVKSVFIKTNDGWMGGEL